MQTTKTVNIKTAWLFATLLCFGLGSAQAQTVTNADAAIALNLGGSWVGGTPAGSGNVAVWDSTVVNNTGKILGGNLSWAGIQILSPSGQINIGTNSSGNILTLGASGIDMSMASNSLYFTNAISLGANQTWNVTNLQTVTVSLPLPAASATLLTLTGGGTNNFTAVGNGAYAGNISLTNGVLEINAVSGNTGANSDVGTGIITNNGATLRNNNGTGVGNVIVWNGNCTLDCNNTSKAWEGEWQGSATTTIRLINMIASGNTYTVGGNGTGGDMNFFTGTVIMADTNSDGSPTAGSFRFNNGGGSPNLGNSLMTLNLGQGNVHFTEKNNTQTTSFGALFGGPNTQIAQQENYHIGGLNLATDTFSGTSTGATSTFAKDGTGQFIWNNTNANTYAGITTVNNGILQVGDGVTLAAGALGSGAVSLAGGSLVYNKPDAFSITNKISGSGGSLVKTNVNVMTYYGTNSASVATIISQGTLLLGTNLVGASLMTCPISVSGGATFDVSQDLVFSLSSTLSGYGAVNGPLVAVTGGTISPGSASVAGTLNVTNSLTESGGVNNQLALSLSGGGLINVVGNLTLSGVNSFNLTALGGGTIPNGTYPLIAYSGTLTMTGNVTNNFTVTAVGVTGTLTNITTTTPPEIAVVIGPATRGPLNLTWVGDGVANNWDTATSNWVNNATSYAFQTGDGVLFNDSAFPNTNVDVAVALLPTSVTVSNAYQYFLTGNGSINGATGLTKTNSGTLSISATNGYTGPTIVGGGTLELFNVANGGSASAIGAALNASTNLVFNGGTTLKYSGVSAATDRGATLNGAGVTVDVAPGANLTENGVLTGSAALTLVDSGTLTLGNANTYLGGTVISNGVLAGGSLTADASGFGTNIITFKGGTLAVYNSTGDDAVTDYIFNNPLLVPAGQVGHLAAPERGVVNSTLTGGGTLNVSASGQRGSFAGDWSAFTGTINIITNGATTSIFRIDNSFGYSNAVINLNDGADLDGGGDQGTYNSSVTFDIGELDGTSLATMGTVSKPTPFPNWRVGWKNTTSTFNGVISDPASGQGSITKVGTGTLFLAGANTFTGPVLVSSGVLALTNGGSINSSTNITIAAGAVIDATGETAEPGAWQVGSGTLQGYGMVKGTLDASGGGSGMITPGGGIAGGIGTLTVTGNIFLSGNGTTWMKINRAASPNSDRLVSSAGSVNYGGGTLVVTNIGPSLHVGDTFTLFSGTSVGSSGSTFGTLVLPGVGNGGGSYITWDTSQLGVNGSVTVTGLSPLPKVTSANFSGVAGGVITLNSTNGIPGTIVYVLTSTNLALPLSSWTTVTNTYFNSNGNLEDPNTGNPGFTITNLVNGQTTGFYLLQTYGNSY